MEENAIDFSKITPEIFSEDNYISTYDCSKDDDMGLNTFYHKEALKFHEEHLGRTYIFKYNDDVVGFCTLAMNKIEREKVDKEDRLPIRMIEYPAALLGRIAVDNRWRKRGLGTFICKWAIGHCLEISFKIGCRYIVLQTNERMRSWYESKLGFKVFNVELNKDGEINYWLYHKLELS